MKRKVSKTQKAIALMEKGLPVSEAARQAKVTTQAVHAALKRIECQRDHICPCCKQPLPETAQ